MTNQDYLVSLASELRKLPKETEWVEFKHNNDKPEEIGEYISALSNAAVLCGKAHAYLLWGIDDASHDVIGTTFSPSQAKVGNEELENWLLRLLHPKINFSFSEFELEGEPVVLLDIERAFRNPVRFRNDEFVRVGSYKKRLKDHPEKERDLWRIFDDTPFELRVAAENLTADVVLQLLDYPTYFNLFGLPLPESRNVILGMLESDHLIVHSDSGKWNILNLGAVLLAKKMTDFGVLARKAIRVVFYRGNSRVETIREHQTTQGYARDFEQLIGLINNSLPSNEIIEQALRKSVPMYPELAIRELIANAIIHQDFFVTGAGPLVEIFSDRMEITNPGKPLVDTMRFLDSPPRSRNEALASFLRRVGVCEERGSGIDKVVFQTELYQLPAPIFEIAGDNTRAVLFAHRPLARMDRDDRVRACYLHTCLKYVTREYMTNTSLRQRFGIEQHNSASASRIIADAVQAKLIRLYDPDASRRYAKYVPFWA